jgi:hypothetical protein
LPVFAAVGIIEARAQALDCHLHRHAPFPPPAHRT